MINAPTRTPAPLRAGPAIVRSLQILLRAVHACTTPWRLGHVPRDFAAPKGSELGPALMIPLFERGRETARSGHRWEKYPPGHDSADEATLP